jgi:RNA polymerase sigma-70 factor (ECF subfamily)
VQPADHLFRREAGRLVAALTRIFGVHNLALAEDVVQDALCRAVEVWKYRGVPDDPSAWLMTTAKNRALDMLRREKTARVFAPELGRLLETEWSLAPVVEELFGEHEIRDGQLAMIFTCCNPRLPEEAQIALVLNILCGFGVAEIAHALLVSEAAIEKRIQRAKKVLAESGSLFDVAGAETLRPRLDVVHRSIYLLFNEGYHGAHPEGAVRTELCAEALRLGGLLAESPVSLPDTHALCALMCLHAARLPARVDSDGNLSPLFEQDRSRWDARLIADGLRLLTVSASGERVSEYHVEAAIAAEHAMAARAEDTDWGRIVELYDTLSAMRPGPVVALSRAIAVAQRDGPERGLEAIAAIADAGRLASYPFYPAAMGDLELRCGRAEAAREHFRAALGVARNDAERAFLERRVAACSQTPGRGEDSPQPSIKPIVLPSGSA